MGLQQFLLAFMSAGSLFFSLYYLFAILVIHKRFISKYLYFIFASLGASAYILFELFSSLPFSDSNYLLFYKLKIISFLVFVPFLMLVCYQCFFPSTKKNIIYIIIISYFIIFLTTPFDIFISLPIKKFTIVTPFSEFIYNIGKQNLTYRMFSVITLLAFIIALIQGIFSKDKSKKYSILVFVFGIISATHDFLIGAEIITNVFTAVYCIYVIDAFIFYDFLLEDRKAYLAVVDLSKQLQKEKDEVTTLKDESERRLRITEIYTRKSLVESIEKGEDPTKFESKNIQIATLFTDIRDFTGISEGLKPFEVVDLLNSYFNRMNSTIIKYNGEIDKLMGDCIMALFKNPDDALKAAIEMRYELERFNQNLKSHSERSEESNIQATSGFFSPLRSAQNDNPNRAINNGIGLNFGEVIIGNIGSESKMDYTVVGDIVNTASRLEALTKYYKVPLIISEDLKNQLVDNYSIRFLDEVLVKGKSHPMRIYEVFDFEPDNIKETKEKNQKLMEEAFSLYQEGDFAAAQMIYDKCSMINEDPVLHFFSDRCRNLQIRKEAGLLEGWNGVFEFMDK